ncbi:MAG: hypothetical protein HY898_30120 [Deltaproteobacteria bacterium]|nr:hypothetical protein [Deltaproteobacteria bacterium]
MEKEPAKSKESESNTTTKPAGTAPRQEPEWAWIGTTRFWLVALALVIVSLFAFFAMVRRVASYDSLVPVITLSGPQEGVSGEKARYGVLVRDRFGAPISGATVRVGFFKGSLIELAHATTGEGGDATVEVQFPADFVSARSLVATVNAGVAESSDGFLVQPRKPAQPGLFVSTDKPLYQPGQTIHIRALAMADGKPIADKPSVIEIRTADNVKVFRLEKKTSAFGIVATDFELADQVKLGTYSIAVTTTITPASPGTSAITARGDRQVEVKRYSLPKLTLALEEIAPFAVDRALRGTARAKWVFGEPVTKGSIKVTLERSGEVIRSATGAPDKEGALRFELVDTARKPAPQRSGSFTLRAKIEVEGGMHAEASKEIRPIGAGEVKLEAFPESGELAPNVAQQVFVVATADPKEGISVRANHGEIVKTNARGIAVLNLPPCDPRFSVDISAFAEDGSEGTLALRPIDDRLVIRPDRLDYAAGDTARVTVLGANAGERVALRLTKGSEALVTGSCVVGKAAAGCEAQLTIPPGTSGLVWVHALSLPVPGRGLSTGTVKKGKRIILAGAQDRDLALRVTPDKPIFAPRETGSVAVAVTGVGGTPVQAQLAVGVADEAVFALSAMRPDLEKIFFTVDKDLAAARYVRRYDYRRPASTERALPAPYEAADAYSAATPPEVRATILAALTTMAEVGEFSVASRSDLHNRADAAVAERQDKLAAWAILLVVGMALCAFVAFGLYGISRFRRPLLLVASAAGQGGSVGQADAARLKQETRGLLADWLLAVLAPPILAGMSMAASQIFGSSGRSNERTLLGAWLILAPFCAVLLLRAVLRVRRALDGTEATSLRRVLTLLPFASFFGHLAVLLVLADEGKRLGLVLGYSKSALLLPVFIAAGAQVTFGFLSVIRQGLLRPVTRRGRVWLLTSRASFVGLPVTLVCLVPVLIGHCKHRNQDWAEYMMEQMETEQISEDRADNKEGGTGTRAKGEEGSMGNPNARAPGGGRAAAAPAAKGEGGATAGPVVRDYFPETLLWAPEVITDDAGRATIKVPFADSITTWRFGLSAVGRGGQLGNTSIPLVVMQDFFVEASLPPVLTQGDELAVPVTVYSYMQGPQDVTLELQGDGISTVGPSKTAIHLAPHETRGFRFAVRADKAGERKVRLQATSASRGDAIERTISVTPNGLSVMRAINGRLIGSATSKLELPANAIDGGNDLYVKVYGGPLSQISEGLDGVFRMPHGCFEQVSSTTYPSVLALEFLARTKNASPELESKARRYIAAGYQRLVSFEVSGGGFSLYGSSPASTTLTAYGLMEFADMARVALVDEALMERTRDWLLKQRTPTGGWTKAYYYAVNDRKPEDDDILTTAYVAWALAESSPAPQKDSRLASVLDTVANASGPDLNDPYSLTLRANALLAGGRTNEARALLDRIVPLALRGEDGAHWTSKHVGVLYSYGNSMEVEVTGLATHALAVAGMQPELRAGALDWLVARRGSYGTWSTTQATIAAMRALLDEAKPAPKDPQDITVLADGQPVETFTMEPRARDVHRLISLRRFATTGNHSVELRATGGGDISYQLVGAHYVPWQRPTGAALALDVGFSSESVTPGATTSCRIKLAWKGKEDARVPLVEIGTPPAFEVEVDDLEALLKSKDALVQRYSVERGKVTLYLSRLTEARPLEFDLRMRALRPARVMVPSSIAYLYYEPEVRAETKPVRLQAM